MWLVRFFLLSIVILVSYTTKAYAYLDPGFFSIIINFFIALIAGAAAYVSLFWSKIKNLEIVTSSVLTINFDIKNWSEINENSVESYKFVNPKYF